MQQEDLKRKLIIGPLGKIKHLSYLQKFPIEALARILRISGGLLLSATLLVSIFWIPLLWILVLPTEVYILDWVYKQNARSDVKKSSIDVSSISELHSSTAERKYTALRSAKDEQKRTSHLKHLKPC